jgi:hypothetical protein
MDLTFEAFKVPSNDSAFKEEFESVVSNIKLPSEDIRKRFDSGESITEILFYVDSLIKHALGDDAVDLDGWLALSVDNLERAGAKISELEGEIAQMAAIGIGPNGKYVGGIGVVVLGDEEKKHVRLYQGASLLLVSIGYLSTVSMLHEQMGWSLYLSIIAPAAGVFLIGFIIKLLLDRISEYGNKIFSIAFFTVASIAIILAVAWAFLLSNEYGSSQKIVLVGSESAAGEHGTGTRFLCSILAEALGASALWARAQEIVRRGTRMDGQQINPNYQDKIDRIERLIAEKQIWSTRQTFAKSLQSMVSSVRDHLHSEAKSHANRSQV